MTEDMFETDWSFLSGVSVETTAPPVKHTEKKPARVYQMLGFEYSLRRPQSPETRAKLKAINTGKITTAETRAKISLALKGRVPAGNKASHKARAKPVMTPHGVFDTIGMAAKVLKQDVKKRIKSGHEGYYFITKAST